MSAPSMVSADTRTRERDPMPSVDFDQAFRFWLKLGFISFGGPAGQISIMHQELVERRRWISEHRFLNALNYTMLLPGPEAQQLATYIGWLFHGNVGGILAGALFVLPSLFILIFLTAMYLLLGETDLIAGVLYGVKPAVTAIVLFAAFRIGSRTIKNGLLLTIACVAFVSIFFFDVPFPYIILGAAVTGFLVGRIRPDYFGNRRGAASPSGDTGAIIDDSTPLPHRARFTLKGAVTTALVVGSLWAAALGLLCGIYGWSGDLTQMGWFFSKAALLTFGGAYAVLPYVFQGAVEQYQWLTAAQMIDGLALGETTPGPLIMIVTFVGFVGGWEKEAVETSFFLSGLAGALVATFFTFLPSFFFILVGAPIVEATRNAIGFLAPLTAITAAVVGVIVNLGLFFAFFVLWPHGIEGPFEHFSALLGVCAFVALLYFRVGIMSVILWSATAGFLHHLVI